MTKKLTTKSSILKEKNYTVSIQNPVGCFGQWFWCSTETGGCQNVPKINVRENSSQKPSKPR